MKLKKDSSDQKLRGAYYTPLRLAQAMTNIFSKENVETILEPSCGDGVFLDGIAQDGLLAKADSVTAVEIEKSEADKVTMRYKEKENVHVLNEDFFSFYDRVLGHNQFDLILGNPPYIRYQYLTEQQREMQSRILESHGMKSNKLINSWVAFLVACVQLLSKHGKIAFVIPAEILQVAYAEDLRLFLSEHLAKITLITFEQLVFPDIEQEILVLIGEKGADEKGIRIIELNDLEDLAHLQLEQNGFQKMRHVKEKWTKYFVSAQESELIQRIREDERFCLFSDFGTINVGVTTGNNRYFSITEETCKKYHLEEVTRPLIGRSSHAHGIYFTEKDWRENREAGKRARLVCFPDDIPFHNYPVEHQNYITLGETNGENEGYKCGIRDRWYIVPSVWIPDAFFLRRNNLYPKFVLNCCKAVSTDTMHRMKFNANISSKNLLLSYYNSITFAFTEICGRSYGGGVLEILPGEMGNIVLPRIEHIDANLREKVLKEVDSIVRCDGEIEKALDMVDNMILVNQLGIDVDWCQKCRVIWKKLQHRRLARA